MKLAVLIPSAGYRANAGARIRYRRMTSALADLGIAMSLVEIDRFDPAGSDCDLVLVSKVYDVRSLIAALVLSDSGIAVGIDLFDDYFSDAHDSRLLHMRGWLRRMVQLSDFAVCSTERLASVVQRYRPDVPLHILNDPSPETDFRSLNELLEEKLARAHASRSLSICWFGIGDNPYFAVGISDVAAHADMLAELDRDGWAVDLTILTNRRALSAESLQRIARLPIQTTVREWSEDAEAALLSKSLACFLPVSAQPFSIGKSLNRAVTALTSGCQVLSAGFPLYAALDPFIYRSTLEFRQDLSQRRLRLSSDTAAALESRLAEVASASREAAVLSRFLSDLPTRPAKAAEGRMPIYLIHGLTSSPAAHAMAKRVGALQVGTSFTKTHLELDVMADVSPGGVIKLHVSERALRRVSPEWRKKLTASRRTGGRRWWSLEGEPDRLRRTSGLHPPVPMLIAAHGKLLNDVADRLRQIFGPAEILVSESSPLPVYGQV